MIKRSKKPAWAQLAQMWANVTGKVTKVYRTPDGMIRFTISDWPMSGQFLAAVEPQQEAK